MIRRHYSVGEYAPAVLVVASVPAAVPIAVVVVVPVAVPAAWRLVVSAERPGLPRGKGPEFHEAWGMHHGVEKQTREAPAMEREILLEEEEEVQWDDWGW